MQSTQGVLNVKLQSQYLCYYVIVSRLDPDSKEKKKDETIKMQNVEKVLWNIKRFFPNPLSNDFIFLQFLYLSEKLFKAVV
jgi:hypothetical protein